MNEPLQSIMALGYPGARRDLLVFEAFGEMGASNMALGKEAVASACQSDGTMRFW